VKKLKKKCPVCGREFEMYYGIQIDPEKPVCFKCWKDRERARSGSQFDGDWNDPCDPAFWDRQDVKDFAKQYIKPLLNFFKPKRR
jgi:hypothetical protein